MNCDLFFKFICNSHKKWKMDFIGLEKKSVYDQAFSIYFLSKMKEIKFHIYIYILIMGYEVWERKIKKKKSKKKT